MNPPHPLDIPTVWVGVLLVEWLVVLPLFGRVDGPRSRGARRLDWGMLAYMKRTTVKLPEELDARLRHEAARRGVSISEITREAIERHLGSGRKLIAAKAGRSGRSDTARRIEEILRKEARRSR